MAKTVESLLYCARHRVDPMQRVAAQGRFGPSDDQQTNDRNRRVSPVALHSGEGRFTEPTAVALAGRPELVFMRRTGPCLGLGSIKSNKKAGVRFAIRRDCFT